MKQGWRTCSVTTNYAFFPAVVPTILQDGQAFVNGQQRAFQSTRVQKYNRNMLKRENSDRWKAARQLTWTQNEESPDYKTRSWVCSDATGKCWYLSSKRWSTRKYQYFREKMIASLLTIVNLIRYLWSVMFMYKMIRKWSH